MRFPFSKPHPYTFIRTGLLVAGAIALISATACEETDSETTTPTIAPQQILSEARGALENLTTIEFVGGVIITPTNGDGEDDLTGEVVGQWSAPDEWVMSLQGFGSGSGLEDTRTIASNGQRVLSQKDAGDEWTEIESSPVEAPTPDTWDFIFNLDDLELRSDELVVNGEDVYRFSGTRQRTASGLPPIFANISMTDQSSFTEAYDLFISKEDLQVRQLVALIDTDAFMQDITWRFESHNEDIDFELPEELTGN